MGGKGVSLHVFTSCHWALSRVTKMEYMYLAWEKMKRKRAKDNPVQLESCSAAIMAVGA
eukprot:m.22363 g.22363  ORF g.22363 m.22363 type:complete len:59 (-) comp10716_c0_seq1:1043-1219(-)